MLCTRVIGLCLPGCFCLDLTWLPSEEVKGLLSTLRYREILGLWHVYRQLSEKAVTPALLKAFWETKLTLCPRARPTEPGHTATPPLG